MSGLVLAYELQRAGVEHVLLERDDVPGGVMRTVWREGVPLDLGPQRTRLTSDLEGIVQELGLSDEMLTAPRGLPLWVYRGGSLRRVPLSIAEALSTDLVSWSGKLRMLLEPLTGGPREDESVAAFLTRKFGQEAYLSFLGPLYGGLYASDPMRMKTRHGLAMTLADFGLGRSLLLAVLGRGLKAREEIPTVGFRGGMGVLAETLAARLGERLRLATPAVSLQRAGSRFRIRLGGRGAGESISADQLVLALPAPFAAGLLTDVAEDAAERVGRLRYNRLAVAHLRSSCDLRGFGYQVAFGEPLETRGVTWNASIFGRDGVFTAYLGGMTNPSVADWKDEDVERVASKEFLMATGCSAEPLLVSRTSIPAWDESWDAISGLSLPKGIHLCANWSSRPGIPGRIAQARRLARTLSG